MTRALQNRLALANIKVKHGWESLSLDAIEPRVENQLKRKRPLSRSTTLSGTPPSASSRFRSANIFDSSPVPAPIFSDNTSIPDGKNSATKRGKRLEVAKGPTSRAFIRSTTRPTVSSWEANQHLPMSSPIRGQRNPHFPTADAVKMSFTSKATTIADRCFSSAGSEEDEADLPLRSLDKDTPYMRSSPPPAAPRTPPQTRLRGSRAANSNFKAKVADEGPNLLLYLATSPSPASSTVCRQRLGLVAPTTPPARSTPLPPSSMMTTPSGRGIFSLELPTTPSNGFNWAEFCNVTPSPAQVAWAKTPRTDRTPRGTKTPLRAGATEARRRLNFDGLLIPSPNGQRPVGDSDGGAGVDIGDTPPQLCSP